MKKRKARVLKKISFNLTFLFFLMLITIYIVISITKSLIVNKPDRINILKYDNNATIYSLGISDESNYLTSFNPDMKILIPGGYGYYRIGALGKLVKLEKNDMLLQKTLSYATSIYIDRYFYPNTSKIYYNSEAKKDLSLPGFKELFFYKSNSSFWDRMYLFFKLMFIEKNKVNILNTYERLNENKEKVFDKDMFDKNYKGLFYRKAYRDERKSVQIIYSNNYDSAFIIGQILEGNGIRVVDISDKTYKNQKCQVIENTKNFTDTAKSISLFFNCDLLTDKTEISDIILNLGNIENKWSIK